MKWLLGTSTSRFNRRHKEFGHLFSGRYKSLLVDGSQSGYLKTVCDYVHLNPARAKLLGPEAALSDFVWSSYPWYLAAPSRRPAWLQVERLLGEWQIPKDSEAGRRAFARGLEERRREELEEEFQRVERAWYLGDEEFRQELLEQASVRWGSSHDGEIVQEAAEAQAQRLVKEGLKRMKWKEKDLGERRKGDTGKVRLACELRANTTMPLAWIAERLHMGSRGYLTWLLYRQRKNRERAI
jgi:putative transposase